MRVHNSSGGWQCERMGTLYYGDNLDILRRYIEHDTVDLVYLDPPFNSAQNYNAFFHEKDGADAASQIRAFEDTWHWDIDVKRAFDTVVDSSSERVRKVMLAFYEFLGGNDMMAYITMMAPRLVELRRVLKPTGSLYLHCDPTASHYLKLLCDAVFGPDNYQNEVVWKRTSAHSSARRYGPNRDVILFYSKCETKTWNSQRLDYSEDYLESKYGNEDEHGRFSLGDLTAAGIRHGESGKPWRGIDPNGKGVHWKFGVGRLDELDKEGRIYWPKSGGLPRYKRYLSEVGAWFFKRFGTTFHRLTRWRRSASATQRKSRSLCLSASLTPAAIPGTWCWTRSAAAARRLTRRRSWAGSGLASTSRSLRRR